MSRGEVMEYGTIKCASKLVNGNTYTMDSCEWVGPPIALVTPELLNELGCNKPTAGDYIEFGPYLLQLLEYDMVSDAFTVQRIDHLLGAAYALRFRLSVLWQQFMAQLIYTLAIWGIANRPDPGERVGWHLVKERWL